MFDVFSGSHVLVMLVVALVVVGPKDLPRLMRMAGEWARKARIMAGGIRHSFDEMARHTELDELRAQIETLRRANPLSDIASAVKTIGDNESGNVAPSTERGTVVASAPSPEGDLGEPQRRNTGFTGTAEPGTPIVPGRAS